MNSPSLPALAAGFSEQSSLDSAPSATSSSRSRANKSSASESQTVFWMPPQSSGTFTDSSQEVTPLHIAAWLTSLAAGSPASRSAPPAVDAETLKTSGLKCSRLCVSLGQSSFLPRTSPDRAKSGAGSQQTFRPRAMACGGRWLSEPPTWAAQTLGKDFGYLPRPTRTANQMAPSMMKHPGCRALQKLVVALGGMKLHPQIWEWQMGWPIGWTDLRPLATDRFLAWRLAHSWS